MTKPPPIERRSSRAWILLILVLSACAVDPVVIEGPPTIASFVATPAAVAPGEAVALSWSVSGADSVRVSGGEAEITVLGCSGAAIVNSVSTTTYTLTASNAFGERTRQVEVRILMLPTIASFGPIAGLVNPGLPNALTWEAEGAEELTLTGPGLPLSGLDVTGAQGYEGAYALPAGATFTLAASNADGTAYASAIAARAVSAFSVLLAGQSNAQGTNLSAAAALAFIAAVEGVDMFGNDYEWKGAYEPLDDCRGQEDTVSIDTRFSDDSCPDLAANTSGVSMGVSLGNELAEASGGSVFLIPAARGGSSASQWQPAADRYDRTRLFGSAIHRARVAGQERSAPLGHRYDGASYGAIVWFQGESDTTSTSAANAYFGKTASILDAFQDELDTSVMIVQLSRRGATSLSDDPTLRNVDYQVVRETQRRMAEGALGPDGAPAAEAEARRHLVVTHDLPMADLSNGRPDGRHLSADAQRELGRRVSLAIREHLLREPGTDGTGPRLLRVETSSAPSMQVRVRFDRPVTAPALPGAEAYSGYFTVHADGEVVPVTAIERDPTNDAVVLITLATATTVDVRVRYMPPPGHIAELAADVIRARACSHRMPAPLPPLCLPAAAFGTTP